MSGLREGGEVKRFTETGKWDDPWFRALKGTEKLVFLYVIDRCNNAGFWEIDEAGMAFQTKLSEAHIQGAWKGLGRGLIRVGDWVWVRRFLRHQKNENLNPSNKAHVQIIALLREQIERFDSEVEFQSFVAPYQPLFRGSGTGQVKDKVRGSAEGDEDSQPPGWEPPIEMFVAECERHSVPAWYAEKKYEVFSAKDWMIGRTPAKWKKLVPLAKRDFVNDGSPMTEAAASPGGNGSKPKGDGMFLSR